MLLIIIFIGFVLLGVLDLTLRKKFNIEKNEKFMDQYINRKHFIFEIWLCAMFLLLVSIKGIVGIPLYVLLFIFFSLVFAIRALLEYIFKKESKRHIISIAYTFVGVVTSIFIILFG